MITQIAQFAANCTNCNAQTELSRLEEAITACHLCPRLVAWREQVASEKRRAFRDWEYWGKPVPGFGDPAGRVLALGLAPGAHGSNRTGRMFTGDSSGIFLYAALNRVGFANQPNATHRADGLRLQDLFITAVCRCAPPDNKPTPQEITTCLPFVQSELALLPNIQVVVALGRIAFDAIHRLYNVRAAPHAFSHGASLPLGDGLPRLIASYHPSRQNTQTGRLTPAMFDSIWSAVKAQLSS